MFPYDPELAAAVAAPPHDIPDVVATMQKIASLCADTDGLKWFNWLYLQVTNAIETRSAAPGGFADPAWIASLDVGFAGLYFSAAHAALTSGSAPGCWQDLFNFRSQPDLTRLQFAFAGMNAHINHDLPQAIVATCQSTGIAPQHGTMQYSDYTAVNSTLDAIIGAARQQLSVRLAGDALPPVNRLEDVLAGWSVSAVREVAWNNAELLWRIKDDPLASSALLDSINVTTDAAGRALLIPV
jgi:hypothetical protein